MAAGFQLDQLLAACAELAKIPPQEDSDPFQEQQQQPLQPAESGGGGIAHNSDDGDDLYADLQQPAGALNNGDMELCYRPCCSSLLSTMTGCLLPLLFWLQMLLTLDQAVSLFSNSRSRYSRCAPLHMTLSIALTTSIHTPQLHASCCLPAAGWCRSNNN